MKAWQQLSSSKRADSLAVCTAAGLCSLQQFNQLWHVLMFASYTPSLHNPRGRAALPALLWCPSLLGNLKDPEKSKARQSVLFKDVDAE